MWWVLYSQLLNRWGQRLSNQNYDISQTLNTQYIKQCSKAKLAPARYILYNWQSQNYALIMQNSV